ACQSCHGAKSGQTQCSEKPEVRALKNNDCVICHMPHNGSVDIPHVAVTDHYIRKRPVDDSMKRQITAFLGLKCFNNDHVDAITTARGYMEFYERYASQRPLLDSAMKYLNRQTDVENGEKQNRDYIRVYYLLNDFVHVTQYAEKLKPADMNDAWTAYRIGEAYYELQQPDKALPWYQRSIQIWPYALDFENKYGTCLLALGNIPEATKVFNFIVDENPDYTSANTNLGYIYMQQGNNTMAYDYLKKAEALDPDHEQTLVNLAVWYHNNNEAGKAKKCLAHLIKKHPDNAKAKAMLMDLEKNGIHS
ncbi:MAG: tetratricopeptide repeat protein, partial [Flavipsychrobacter sp.]